MIALPIDSQLPAIAQALREKKNLVLSAAPGAGKTTRLPPQLLQLTDRKVLVLEPRRIAAVGAALRISEEQNWQLGYEVGYQIRFDSKVSESTRLIFLTEALLNRKLIADPILKDVGMVVLDEFHERSQHVDLALGLLKELQELERPDLQIVVMSATLQADPIAQFLGDCSIVQVPGQSYPLEIHYIPTAQKLRTGPEFIELVCKQAKNISLSLGISEHLLVFLPGLGEIERCSEALGGWGFENKIRLFKLHGNLSLEEQREVLKPTTEKKIIFSTNVAESSITIDGVTAVLDSGLQRRSSINPKTGFPSLDLTRISKSSAIQRSGRAARQKPGKCLRLFSKMDELSMTDQEQPEILRTDLSEALLFLAHQGISDFQNFAWFEIPPLEALQRAERHLISLGALNGEKKLTVLGKKLITLPLPPRLGKLLLEAFQLGQLQLGADLAALLLERDILRGQDRQAHLECDLALRLEVYRASPNRFPSVERASQQLQRLLGKIETRRDFDFLSLQKILLSTFSDQLCRRRKIQESRGLMMGGRGVVLDAHSQVRQSEFFVALSLMEGLSASETRVGLASGFSSETIQAHFQKQITDRSWVEFDQATQKVLKKNSRVLTLPLIGDLALETERTSPASKEDSQRHLPEIATKALPLIKEKNESLKKWLERFEFFKKYFPQNTEISDETWKEIMAESCYGENSLANLFSKDLVYFVESKLDPTVLTKFHKGCPVSFIVPSGSQIPVNYSGSNPSLEVRLQEIFGWNQTPEIMEKTVPLTLTLLGPNYRPVQVTQDLASFWKTAYIEVKKEMKSRYPKHSWPDDPLTAIPQAKGRRRPAQD